MFLEISTPKVPQYQKTHLKTHIKGSIVPPNKRLKMELNVHFKIKNWTTPLQTKFQLENCEKTNISYWYIYIVVKYRTNLVSNNTNT